MTLFPLPLFASPLFSAKIDPSLFEKEKIIKHILKNYKKQPIRDKWSNTDIPNYDMCHHYYDDWENPNLKPPDLTSLVPLYTSIFENLFKTFVPTKPDVNWNWYFHIVNITVYKDNNSFMRQHHHAEYPTAFSCIHYISADETSQPLSFVNPGTYINWLQPSQHLIASILDMKDYRNSQWATNWEVSPEEDTIYIFPSYLMHRTDPVRTKLKKPRIAIVLNLFLNKID